VIVLLEPGTTAGTVRDLLGAIREMGLDAIPLEDVKGNGIEVRGAERGRVLELRGRPGVQEILTRRRALTGGEPLWPHGALRLGILALPLLVAVLLLSAFAPPGLGDGAQPGGTEGSLVVEWYLRPLTALLGAFPSESRVAGSLIASLYWVIFFAWPFLDHLDPGTRRGRLVILAMRFMGVALIFLLVLLILLWRP
jgi:hypothetical protein